MPDAQPKPTAADVVQRHARALFDHDNADMSAEWRDMAWADMGGSEPSEERVEYELRAAERIREAASVLHPHCEICGRFMRALDATRNHWACPSSYVIEGIWEHD